MTQIRPSSKSLDKSNGKRKSAFSPYKSTAKVLTNLQRGNTEASIQAEILLSFHERAGQGEITEHQIRQLPNIDALDDNELSALHWASYYGQLSTARLLIKYGANVSRLGPDFVSPLLLAAAQGHHEIVRLVLQHGADPNQTDVVNCRQLTKLFTKCAMKNSFDHILIILGWKYSFNVCYSWKSSTYMQRIACLQTGHIPKQRIQRFCLQLSCTK